MLKVMQVAFCMCSLIDVISHVRQYSFFISACIQVQSTVRTMEYIIARRLLCIPADTRFIGGTRPYGGHQCNTTIGGHTLPLHLRGSGWVSCPCSSSYSASSASRRRRHPRWPPSQPPRRYLCTTTVLMWGRIAQTT
jgi:hypothetical protein